MGEVPVFGDKKWIRAAAAPRTGGSKGRRAGVPWHQYRGIGPAGYFCGDCRYCEGVRSNVKTFWKCNLVPITKGPDTDIELSDSACKCFRAKGFVEPETKHISEMGRKDGDD